MKNRFSVKNYVFLLIALYAANFVTAQTTVITLSPNQSQGVKRLGNSVQTYQYFSDNTGDVEFDRGSASNDETKYRRYEFNHPNFLNSDISAITLNLTFNKTTQVYTMAPGIAGVYAPDISTNISASWSSANQSVIDAINWGTSMFTQAVGTPNNGTTASQSNGYILNNLTALDQADTKFTLGFYPAQDGITITGISVAVTYQTYAIGNNVITLGTIQSFVCSGQPSAITGSQPTNGSWTYLYQWQSSANGTSGWTNISGATSINYQPPVLSQTTYYRRVVTSTPQPVSNSNVVVVTGNPPAVPTGIAVAAQSTSQLTVSWNTVSGATSYKIYDCANPSTPIGNVSTLSFPVTGLAINTTYQYKVAAVCAAGTGVASACTPGTTYGVAPQPGNITVSPASTSALNLSWLASPSAYAVTSYDIYNCSTSAFVANVAGTSYQVTGLTPATTYQYKIRAVNVAGSSVFSNCGSGATYGIPSAPIGVAVQPISTSQLNVSWNASTTGATSYQIYDCPISPALPTLLGTVNAPTTTFASTGLTAGTTYQYNIVAVNAAGSSPGSGCNSGTTGTPIANNSICCAQTFICSGSPSPLTGSSPSGGIGGTYTYAWETDNGTGTTWSPIGSANSANYTPPAISQTTQYRRIARSGPTNLITDTSTPVTITITQPGVPSGLTAVPQSQSSILLSWASSGASSYQIYNCITNALIATVNTPTLTYLHAGLATYTQYNYYIKSVCGTFISSASGCVSATTLPPPLTNPNICCYQLNIGYLPTNTKTGPVPTGGTGTYAYQWESIVNILAPPNTYFWTAISGANSQNYTPPYLTQSMGYRRITTSGPLSVTSNAVFVDVYPPPPPTGVILSSPSAYSQLLTWNPSTNAGGYDIYDCNTSTYITSVGPSATSYLITGLTPNTTYKYYIVATSGPLVSVASSCVMGTTPSVPLTQQISTFAGNGSLGYAGDGGAANLAQIGAQGGIGIAGTPNGEIYFCDRFNAVVRKVDLYGNISRVAGNVGSFGYAGDGGPATQAKLHGPMGIVFDQAGNMYFTEIYSHCIRKVDAVTQKISTFAGQGTVPGYSGDGGPATLAKLNAPTAITIDQLGNIYFVDGGNYVIRRIDPTGQISTVVGTSVNGYSGDGGPPTMAMIGNVSALTTKNNLLYLSDMSWHVVRVVDFAANMINKIAGTLASPGYSGDGGQAINAQLQIPAGICFDDNANLCISDYGNNVIRKIDINGIISTYAGVGNPGYSGDGGQPITANFNSPASMYFDSNALYFVDDNNARIRIIYSYCYSNAGPANVYTPQGCCGGAVTTLGSQPLDGLSYAWLNSGGDAADLSCANCARPTTKYASIEHPMSYVVTVTGPFCTTKQSVITVHIIPWTGESCCRIGHITDVDNNDATAIKEIDPPSTGNVFSVFPNPSDDHITVQLSDKTEYLRIIDILGNTVYERSRPDGEKLDIDISAYRSGIYFVIAKTGNKLEKTKLIVE